MSDSTRILFAGLGSPHGDDQIGWQIADELESHAAELHHIAIRKAAIPLDITGWLDDIQELHVCDACSADRPPGTLIRFDVSPTDDHNVPRLPDVVRERSRSTHDFSLADVLDLAARLGTLPPKVVIHAVAGCRFDPGTAIMDDIAARLPDIARTIQKELTDARDLARTVAANPS